MARNKHTQKTTKSSSNINLINDTKYINELNEKRRQINFTTELTEFALANKNDIEVVRLIIDLLKGIPKKDKDKLSHPFVASVFCRMTINCIVTMFEYEIKSYMIDENKEGVMELTKKVNNSSSHKTTKDIVRSFFKKRNTTVSEDFIDEIFVIKDLRNTMQHTQWLDDKERIKMIKKFGYPENINSFTTKHMKKLLSFYDDLQVKILHAKTIGPDISDQVSSITVYK